MCLVIAGILEFFLGNTFPFLVFVTYGSHFLVYGTISIPSWNAVSAYNGGNPYGDATQTQTAAFAAGFGTLRCVLSAGLCFAARRFATLRFVAPLLI